MATKRNIWKDASAYGTYEGEKGNPDQWFRAFEEAWGMDSDSASKIVGDSSPWGILGVPEGSPLDVVKKAYRKLILIHHPDKGGDVQKCQQIIAAWEVIKGRLG